MSAMWKFPLNLHLQEFTLNLHLQEFKMPKDAEVAYFDFQDAAPCIWAIVDPMREKETRRFQIFGTGHDLPEHACYVGTAQQGPFVWHLFELL